MSSLNKYWLRRTEVISSQGLPSTDSFLRDLAPTDAVGRRFLVAVPVPHHGRVLLLRRSEAILPKHHRSRAVHAHKGQDLDERTRIGHVAADVRGRESRLEGHDGRAAVHEGDGAWAEAFDVETRAALL